MLRLLAELQTSVQQGIPVIGRFLTEYLNVWDGHQHFTAVLTLISQVLGLAITTMHFHLGFTGPDHGLRGAV